MLKKSASGISHHSLHLHPLNLFIRRHQFVPDLHHQLKRHVCLLQRDHRAVNVLRFARHEGVHRSTGFQLRVVDLSDRRLERIHES